MKPSAPLPHGWEPSLECKQELHRKYGKEIDLRLSLDKFKAYHCEGQCSRDWDQRFTTWVITDVMHVREKTRGGTDDMGVPFMQREDTTTPLQPGDEGYISFDELVENAQRQGLAAQEKEQP